MYVAMPTLLLAGAEYTKYVYSCSFRQILWSLLTYYQAFTLSDPRCSTPGCVFTDGGKAGECTNNVGTLSYAEIRRKINGGGTVTLNKAAAVKQVTYEGNQWVSYDDEETLKMKIDYANKLCLGGYAHLIKLCSVRKLI